MNNNSNLNEEQTKKKEIKGIAFLTVGILTIVVAIAGATYAFFQVTATNTDVIKGDSAYVSVPLDLTIAHATASSVSSQKLIPQLDSAIQNAVTGTSSKSCIDANGNAICKVFTITLTNKTTTKYYVKGTITFSLGSSSSKFESLKMTQGTSSTAGFSGATAITMGTPIELKYDGPTGSTVTELAAGATKNYYIVVWISEKNTAQTNDSGSFSATVTFNGYDSSGVTTGGITSTIKS